MRLHVKGKNVEVTDAIHEYAERKLGKLSPQLAEPTRVELELAVEKNPSIADNNIAEATIWTKGPVLRAREAALREEEVEQDPTLAGQVSRQRADFVANCARAASSCSGVPMSNHSPGSSQA